jgi:selenocysteine-specific elongation factor
MNRIIIGTAGHIDHGKTTIVRELTGFDGDASPEEKKRGITIELSFSSMKTDDKEISFIDVPGHERLVKTMIGGAFGFDYAMVVVDSHEGVKAQTIEHLLILNSIKPIEVIVVLSKSDLVDEAKLTASKNEIKTLFDEYKNLTLAKILPFSVKKPEQKEALKEYLFSLKNKKNDNEQLARLYIDRSFAIAGAGCVVTGTLQGGQINSQDALFIPQLQKSVKIKSIQTHNMTVNTATSGQRTAINLSGISHNEISKGMLLTKKGFLRGFKDIDVVIHKNSGSNIKHASELTLFFGTMALNCKILILSEDDDKIIATLKFGEDMFLVYGEPFIIRNSSQTLGGGIVIGAVGDPIKKSQKEQLLRALVEKDFLKAFSILIEVHKSGFGLICSFQRFGIVHDEALKIAKNMSGVIIDEKALVVYPHSSLEMLKATLMKIYTKNTMALLSPISLKHKLPWTSEYLSGLAFEALDRDGILSFSQGLYSLAGSSENQDMRQELSNQILDILNEPAHMPPAPYNIYDDLDLDRAIGDDILKKLCSSGKAIRLAHNHFIGTKSIHEILKTIRSLIKKDGFVTAISIKESLAISRKYAINYLEYLDRFDDIENIDQKRVFKK